jgi:uncharacterized protein YjbI with pentapeptide repeats
MANPEHLEILKQGVERWNRWRQECLNVTPDLGGADLRGANLSRASLGGANLGGADLARASLTGVT